MADVSLPSLRLAGVSTHLACCVIPWRDYQTLTLRKTAVLSILLLRRGSFPYRAVSDASHNITLGKRILTLCSLSEDSVLNLNYGSLGPKFNFSLFNFLEFCYCDWLLPWKLSESMKLGISEGIWCLPQGYGS